MNHKAERGHTAKHLTVSVLSSPTGRPILSRPCVIAAGTEKSKGPGGTMRTGSGTMKTTGPSKSSGTMKTTGTQKTAGGTMKTSGPGKETKKGGETFNYGSDWYENTRQQGTKRTIREEIGESERTTLCGFCHHQTGLGHVESDLSYHHLRSAVQDQMLHHLQMSHVRLSL